jgi:ubiquinone/menaquinone biosynthesis C-methylase UbiE
MAEISEVERVHRCEASAFRRDLMGRVSSGLALNFRLLEAQEQILRRRVRPIAWAIARGEIVSNRIINKIARLMGASLSLSFRDLLRRPIGYRFDEALEYLWSDWAGTSEGECQITTIQQAVSESIQRYCDRGGRAVYLGAGLGRHAFEGGKHFSSVVATEISFAFAALLMALQAGPVDFCRVNWMGVASERELVEVHRAVFTSENYGSNIDYVIANALSLPIPDASLEAVVSIFFTDVIPLSRLLPEVRRVLRPGGRFISVGPLVYHFEDKAEWLTQEEMRFVIESMHEMAFESGDTVLEMPYMDHPGSIRSINRVWSFVATRR